LRVRVSEAMSNTGNKSKSSSNKIVGWLVLVAMLWLLAHIDACGDVQREYYRTLYGNSSSNVLITAQPHDCEFMTAPLGEKNCHYEKTIEFDKSSDTVYVGWSKIKE
jgi:hypothetical protein